MIKIAPSILSWDFTEIGKTLSLVEKAGVDIIHLDIMDGHFVPNISFGPAVVESLNGKTSLPLDAHLMIEDPGKFIGAFKNAGADMISVHVETVDKLSAMIEMIRKEGLKVGVALNPETGIESIIDYLPEVDKVLLMTVNPGFGAQKFIEAVLPKISRVREAISRKGLNVDIEVDGGINAETAPKAVKAGANILVAGNYLYSAKNISEAVNSLKKCI